MSSHRRRIAKPKIKRGRPVAFETLEGRQFFSVSVGASEGEGLRINAAGDAFIDSSGNPWQSDTGFTNGTLSTQPFDVIGTEDDQLFYTRRVGKQFSYSLPAQNGMYTLQLYFAEPFWETPNKRVFDVSVEGKQVIKNYDIVAEAGARSAVAKSFAVNITDGSLDIEFVRVKDNAIVSGLSLVPLAPGEVRPVSVEWTQTNDAPISRVESVSVKLAGKLYVFGGFTPGGIISTARMDVLDLASGKWTRGPDLPGARTHQGAATDGRYIYLVAGQFGDDYGPGTNTAWKYDTFTSSWSPFTSLPEIRYGGGMECYDNKLYFFGGNIEDRVTDSNKVWSIDLIDPSAQWVPRAPLLHAVDHVGHALVAGKIYAVGGETGHQTTYDSQSYMQQYDPVLDQWTDLAPMPVAVSHIENMVIAVGNYIGVMGGQMDNLLVSNAIQVYDIANNRWSIASSNLPALRKGSAACLYRGKVVLSGGQSYDGSVYQTHDDTWIGELI